MVKRINKACKYFPCHKALEDCTFCWCPFYPCLDISFGNFVHSKKLKKDIWSCQDCSWIHKKKTVNHIFELIKRKSPQSPAFRSQLSGEKTGAIILAHGSRASKVNGRISDIIKLVKKKTKLLFVEQAHLQLSKPDLSKSVKKLANKGCVRIIIVPFFLLSGNHVKRDIPEVIKKEQVRYPNIRFIYTEDLGLDTRISDIVIERIANAGT